MDADKAVSLLRLFPKDRKQKSFDEVRKMVGGMFDDDEELKAYLTHLRAEKYIRLDFGGWAITEEGLDFLVPYVESPEQYVLRKFIENNGIFNILNLRGQHFKSNAERTQTLETLKERGWIAKLGEGLVQDYRLTDKFHRDHLERYKNMALPFIKNLDGRETGWDYIVQEINLPSQYENDLKQLLQAQGFINVTIRTKEGDFFKGLPKVAQYLYGLEPEEDKPMVNPQPAHAENERPQPSGKEEKAHFTMKAEIFWPLAIAVVGGAFALGLYFGNNKFDRDKSDFYNEKVELGKKVQSMRDSLNKLVPSKDSADKKIRELQQENDTLRLKAYPVVG